MHNIEWGTGYKKNIEIVWEKPLQKIKRYLVFFADFDVSHISLSIDRQKKSDFLQRSVKRSVAPNIRCGAP